MSKRSIYAHIRADELMFYIGGHDILKPKYQSVTSHWCHSYVAALTWNPVFRAVKRPLRENVHRDVILKIRHLCKT